MRVRELSWFLGYPAGRSGRDVLQYWAHRRAAQDGRDQVLEVHFTVAEIRSSSSGVATRLGPGAWHPLGSRQVPSSVYKYVADGDEVKDDVEATMCGVWRVELVRSCLLTCRVEVAVAESASPSQRRWGSGEFQDNCSCIGPGVFVLRCPLSRRRDRVGAWVLLPRCERRSFPGEFQDNLLVHWSGGAGIVTFTVALHYFRIFN